ncbi:MULTISPECIES: hypothetical protein [Dermabacter]|uniref:hypothetical protein n=1 Tax=Dermabacter TaxID=36739 RepID=UPI0003536A90|nr:MULTISPECIES: hypothetical protein [Dermabacter]EPH14506.1 hypothetical protein HMPREF1484_01809 [Dermabacter sp. HFH0086]MCT1708454.1 hypothetical protein [Dermabacter hominis]MCT1717185.1 hypothetical protein [Dermabacter hominis]
MTPPKYAQAFPSATAEQNITAANARVEARIAGKGAITPPQFATLLQAWRLEKLA